jgi:hypothetical protein
MNSENTENTSALSESPYGRDSHGFPFERHGWGRKIKPEWHVEGQHTANLRADIADMMAEPRFLTPMNISFFDYILRRRLNGRGDAAGFVMLTAMQLRSLRSIVRRYINPHHGHRFLQAQRLIGRPPAESLRDRIEPERAAFKAKIAQAVLDSRAPQDRPL